MTCVVGIADGRRVWIGADSQVNSALGVDSMVKVGRLRCGAVVGAAGDAGFVMLARVGLDPLPPEDGETIEAWAWGRLLPCMHEARRAMHLPNNIDGDMLVGVRGQLVYVNSGTDVHGYGRSYGAIGDGAQFAMGLLYEYEQRKRRTTVSTRIKRALECAAHHSDQVGPPFKILSTGT